MADFLPVNATDGSSDTNQGHVSAMLISTLTRSSGSPEQTGGRSVAPQEFGEEAGTRSLNRCFGLGRPPSQPQFPFQSFQLRLVQQLKVLRFAVGFFGQLQQPGGLWEFGKLSAARRDKADRRLYPLLDGGADGGGDDITGYLSDEPQRSVAGLLFTSSWGGSELGRLLWPRRRKAEAVVIVSIAIGRCPVVKRREFWETAGKCFFSVQV